MKKIGILTSSLFLILLTHDAGGVFAASNLNKIPEVKNTSRQSIQETNEDKKYFLRSDTQCTRYSGSRGTYGKCSVVCKGLKVARDPTRPGDYKCGSATPTAKSTTGLIKVKSEKVVGQRLYQPGLTVSHSRCRMEPTGMKTG